MSKSLIAALCAGLALSGPAWAQSTPSAPAPAAPATAEPAPNAQGPLEMTRSVAEDTLRDIREIDDLRPEGFDALVGRPAGTTRSLIEFWNGALSRPFWDVRAEIKEIALGTLRALEGVQLLSDPAAGPGARAQRCGRRPRARSRGVTWQ